MKTTISVAACCSALCIAPALAQEYPSKPVRILMAQPPGGGPDVFMRMVANAMGPDAGQTILIENRTGAEGIIAAEACRKAPPDGHTLCVQSNGLAALMPAVRPKMPYDPKADFSEIVLLFHLNSALAVNAALPVKSVGELFALAKAKPGSVTFGTIGWANSSYSLVQWLHQARGIRFYGVPYKTPLQAFQATAAGEIDVSIINLGALLPQVKAGKVRPLAMQSNRRSALLPDLPTFREAGFEHEMLSWMGLFGPAGMDKALVARVNTLFSKTLGDPALTSKAVMLGVDTEPPAGRPPVEFAAFLEKERGQYVSIARSADLKYE